MGLVERTGGRKWWLAVVALVGFFGLLYLLAAIGRLDVGTGGVLVGAITWVLTQFGLLNTANNKAALAAGKAKDEEATRLAGLSDSDVLAAASATDAVAAVADGAAGDLSGAGDACRAGITQAGDAARERLRGAATPGV